MAEIHIQLPDQQPELEAAIKTFFADEFQQTVVFQTIANNDEPHKSNNWLDNVWKVAVVVATLEGTLQFAERVHRMAHVQQLLTTIQASGQAVYLKINQHPAVDLSKKSVDETMDLFADNCDESNNKTD